MPVELVEFRQNLLRRFVALFPAEILDDIAELALERTSARSLQCSRQRPVVWIKVPARNRGLAQIGFVSGVFPLPGARSQVGEKLACDGLQFAQIGRAHV